MLAGGLAANGNGHAQQSAPMGHGRCGLRVASTPMRTPFSRGTPTCNAAQRLGSISSMSRLTRAVTEKVSTAGVRPNRFCIDSGT